MLAPILAAERPWHRRTDPDPSTALRAHLLAAVLGCLPNTCCHLRKGGPQPALVLLTQRRVACVRCAATIRRPLTAGDECDVCGEREVATFHPFACHQGPALITGDACPDCAEVLGIGLKERSA